MAFPHKSTLNQGQSAVPLPTSQPLINPLHQSRAWLPCSAPRQLQMLRMTQPPSVLGNGLRPQIRFTSVTANTPEPLATATKTGCSELEEKQEREIFYFSQ